MSVPVRGDVSLDARYLQLSLSQLRVHDTPTWQSYSVQAVGRLIFGDAAAKTVFLRGAQPSPASPTNRELRSVPVWFTPYP